MFGCPRQQYPVVAVGNLGDVVSTYNIKHRRASQQSANDVVIETFVRQPFHWGFRRAISRARKPVGDHSG